MNHQQFEFRVWDKPNKMFLLEFQTEYGEWVWGRGADKIGRSTWKWVIDHPDDFAISMYIKANENIDEKRKIFTGDILDCWDHAADDGVGKHHEGSVEFIPGGFSLLTENGVYLPNFLNAENIKIIGNVYEHPHLVKRLNQEHVVR